MCSLHMAAVGRTPLAAVMCGEIYLIHKNLLQKSTRTRTKNIFKMNKSRDVAVKKNRYKRSRDKKYE